MKVFVIGGGASGLTSAIYASNNNEVTIIEKNNTLGKKILVTGNGRCNYFNEDFTIEKFTSENDLSNIITELNIKKAYHFFNMIGIVGKVTNGYYYPLSNQAVSIQNTLISEINKRNIKVIYDTVVNSITKVNNKFVITTNNGTYEADKVIYSTGSKAYNDTSVEDNNYKILENLGHKIVKVYPGLSKLKTNNNFKDINGVRVESQLSLYIDNKLKHIENGELLFNEDGISGICVMQLSNIANRYIDNNKVNIKINLLDKLDIKDFDTFNNYFTNRDKLLGKSISELFDTILNYKLVNYILKISHISLNKRYSNLTKDEIITLYNNLVELNLLVTGYSSYKSSQICTGGISLNDINLNTMESKLVDGLYITGEILDVAGFCGGYNLGFAWISGILAGENI